jgi:transcription elongation factor GreA
MENYLTPEGLAKLKKELDYLENTQRKELADKLNYAISFGDLRENAAYHQAKEQQGFVEGRISELKTIINSARIVKPVNADKVQIGSRVAVISCEIREEYQVVGPDEVDVFSGKISYLSPLGKVLLGQVKGCRVRFEAPGGVVEYEIVEIM